MIRLEWVFLMQLAMGIIMIIFLQKLTQMKKQVDEVTREVMNYISYITEDMEEELSKNDDFVLKENEKIKDKNELKTPKHNSKMEKEEAENRLIQAVLREYFP